MRSQLRINPATTAGRSKPPFCALMEGFATAL
jgi:hypothetical protein